MAKEYNQFCGVAKALDELGERWTLLIIRDLLIGPMRFSEIQKNMKGMAPNLLTQRLSELEERELIEKYSAGARPMYKLTPKGESVEKVLLALGEFGAKQAPEPSAFDVINVRWGMCSLRRLFQGSRKSWVGEIHLGEDVYQIVSEKTRLISYKGSDAEPDFIVSGNIKTIMGVLRGRLKWEKIKPSGGIVVEGDQKCWLDCVKSFEQKEAVS